MEGAILVGPDSIAGSDPNLGVFLIEQDTQHRNANDSGVRVTSQGAIRECGCRGSIECYDALR